MDFHGGFYPSKISHEFYGGFYPSGNTLDYKMTHWLFTLFQKISNILSSSLLTFSVIYTFYFYIASEGLKIYQKYLIKKVPDFPFLEKSIWDNLNDYLRNSFLEGLSNFSLPSCCLTAATLYHEPPEEANLIKSFKHKLKNPVFNGKNLLSGFEQVPF